MSLHKISTNQNKFAVRKNFFLGVYSQKGECIEESTVLASDIASLGDSEPDLIGHKSARRNLHDVAKESTVLVSDITLLGYSETELINHKPARRKLDDVDRIESIGLFETRPVCIVIAMRLAFGPFRYKDDSYDRIWFPYNMPNCVPFDTPLPIDSLGESDYKLPSRVMKTAVKPLNDRDSLDFDFETGDSTLEFYVYMHFAELEKLQENQSREFDIQINGLPWKNSVVPNYLNSTTIDTRKLVRGTKLSFSISKTPDSSLPPILDAMEMYIVKDSLQAPTDQGDVDAIIKIKSRYAVDKTWQGDPCAPRTCWDGLNCTYTGYDPPRIISLDLSSRGLLGNIDPSFADLRELQYLDLSNNSLTGQLPDFLSELPLLRFLNLTGNKLSDKTKNALSWKERLQIAVDVAHGLEYLHYGCKPPIIHRDVKSANILLNEDLQAKIADFGFSRDFPLENESHLSTAVVGTFGYLDPEYFSSNRLTEKSDVYSFGIVLLELITGRPAILRSHENTHIVDWVSPNLARGDIRSIFDPRLQGNFDTNSVWKALETAMACLPSISIQRPTMTQVLIELKECSTIEIAHDETWRMEGNTFETNSVDPEIEMGPQAR
ncbi:hypothetical protein L1049_004948 [Liquidambar formosana]|uniref:Protein kinase domain-containing protein n=1 Tax=Liquidambar formosana TaxID=63359 RepID=A0AAP0RPB4_LIQFO